MASISKHPGDIANWVTKVIMSCNTIEQVTNAGKLAQLFYRKGKNKGCSWQQHYEHRLMVSQRLSDICNREGYKILNQSAILSEF